MSPIVRYTRVDQVVVPGAQGIVPRREAGAARPGLLTAWLLLLLGRHPTHGYELRRRLHRNGLAVDAAVLYRALRRLEDDGCLLSQWLEPAAGPSRRLYRLTPAGRRRLEAAAASITVTRDVHDAFLRAHASWGTDLRVDDQWSPP